jgi:hypothetical protein
MQPDYITVQTVRHRSLITYWGSISIHEGFVVAKWQWNRLLFKYFGFHLPVIPPVLHIHLSSPQRCKTGTTSQHVITSLVLRSGFTCDLAHGWTLCTWTSLINENLILKFLMQYLTVLHLSNDYQCREQNPEESAGLHYDNNITQPWKMMWWQW